MTLKGWDLGAFGKFSDIDIVYVFMRSGLGVSMPVVIAQEGTIPEDNICKICKKKLQANLREATSILQKQKEGGRGASQKEEENGTMSTVKEENLRLYEKLRKGNHILVYSSDVVVSPAGGSSPSDFILS